MKVRIEVKEQYYYEMLSVLAGVEIKGEYDLVQTIRELSAQREEYRKVEDAIHAVRGCGYGVVIPGREEIQLEEPAVIHQGNKYGVKIKSVSPSIHMIKANIETEIAPIVGSEQQAEDLIAYIKESAKSPEGIWNTNTARQNSRIPCRKLSTTAGAEWCVLSFNTKAVRIFLSNCAIILEKRTKIAYNPNCEKKRRKM